MTGHTRGVALLATVLVVALATMLIAGLLDRGQIGQARALQDTRTVQAFAFQQGLELWAARILREDVERGGGDSRNDVWAQPMPPITVPEGMIHGFMRDLDGCFNLNGLRADEGSENTLAHERFRRLLRALELDVDLVETITDWLDAGSVARTGGAEDAFYATLDPPRRTANAPFVHVSELRAVAGIDAAVYERLMPHVCARPDTRATLNINTASPELLMSLDERITLALARRLHAGGRANYTLEGFRDALASEGIEPLPVLTDIGVESYYFVAEAEMVLGEVPVRLYSLLERRDNLVRVIARSQGNL